MSYNDYLKSKDWKQKRSTKYSKSKTKRCAICYSDESLQVHHLIYRPDLKDTESSDLRILCGICHETAHELINSGKIKFKTTKHTHRFSRTKNAVIKHLGLETITKKKQIYLDIKDNYNCLSRKPFKINHPEITQVLTKKIIDAGKSKRGCWNLAQFRLFGFENFPKKNWQFMVIGQEWPKEVITQFLFLKNKHLRL